jgi:opacity protein-like surface antigen
MLVLIISASSFSQDISNYAIGVRFGDNDGFGAEVTYQHRLGYHERLEVDFGYRDYRNFDAFKLTGVHQWVWNIVGGFNWYVGVGAGIGSWSYHNGHAGDDEDGLFANVVGNLGLEYSFYNAPLLVSLDFRPEQSITGNYGEDTDLDLAVSFRYQF